MQRHQPPHPAPDSLFRSAFHVVRKAHLNVPSLECSAEELRARSYQFLNSDEMLRPKASRAEIQLEATDGFGMGDVRKVKALRGEELDPPVPRSWIQARTYFPWLRPAPDFGWFMAVRAYPQKLTLSKKQIAAAYETLSKLKGVRCISSSGLNVSAVVC